MKIQNRLRCSENLISFIQQKLFRNYCNKILFFKADKIITYSNHLHSQHLQVLSGKLKFILNYYNYYSLFLYKMF